MIRILFIILFLFSTELFAKDEKPVDFKNIRNVLENDMLSGSARAKEKKNISRIQKKLARKKSIYNVPKRGDFWNFLTELWLVKNATIAKWDFQKPDYGIEDTFERFLEKLGIYEKSFRLLIVNSPDFSHFALPADNGSYIFILSLPFIRTLDLTKLEISILLLEDMFRADVEYFKNKIMNSKLKALIGSNFYKKKSFDVKLIKNAHKIYDEIIFDKGYDFQVQFEVTKSLASLFKSEMKLWNTYFKLLGKIDDLVKSNILYQKYIRIYPSPELQLKWLRPDLKKYQR